MEYNTLSLAFLSSKEDLNKYIERIKSFILTHILQNPEIDIFKSLNTDLLFDNHNEGINTDFIFSDLLGYRVRILIYSEYYSIDNAESERWIEFSILFSTSDLAKDPKNDDFLMSDFEYSDKSKQVIKSLAEELFKAFPDSYVLFGNEFQNASASDAIEFSDQDDIYFPEFEYAVIPLNEHTRKFKTYNSHIDKDGYRIMCSEEFE